MRVERYRITTPTVALSNKDGRKVVGMVPTGSIITVERADIENRDVVDVTWNGKKLTMFTQDLRSRAELVKETST